MEKVNALYLEKPELRSGYAPFCKHLFVQNFTDARCSYAEITEENRQFLRSEYSARAEYELPVLKRFFKAEDVKVEKAKFLDVILYSREQIEYEESQVDKKHEKCEEDYDWGVISIKAQDLDHEIEMEPITMMRNALGAEEGGSGVALDKAKYQKSVEVWQKHALVLD